MIKYGMVQGIQASCQKQILHDDLWNILYFTAVMVLIAMIGAGIYYMTWVLKNKICLDNLHGQ